MLLLWLSINRNIAFEFFNYLNNNEKLTTFIIVELLEDNNYIFDKNKLIILPTDIALAIGMVESSHDEDKKNVLINIRKLFTKINIKNIHKLINIILCYKMINLMKMQLIILLRL